MPTADDDYKPPQPSILMRKVVFPFYDWIVQFFPRWLTPNQITCFGIFATVTASMLAFFSLPKDLKFNPPQLQPLPSPPRDDLKDNAVLNSFLPEAVGFSSSAVLLITIGVLNLVYCVADNTDGRQARRLRMSSAIGEYLDHGLDCVTSLMSTFVLIYCVGLPASTAAAGVAVIAFVTCISHIVNYEQGIMIWGNDVASVDEAMLGFGFAPMIPVFFANLTTARVPFLPELRVLDVAWWGFLASQVHVAYEIFGRNRQAALRAPTLFLVITIAIMASLVGSHSATYTPCKEATSGCCSWFTAPLQIFAGLNYPAVFTIALASVASILCHIPIAAKCMKSYRMENWPLAIVIIVWFIYAANPAVGAAVAVYGHAVQIFINIDLIKAAKRKQQQ